MRLPPQENRPKVIPVGRLGSGPRLVGRIGSEVRVSASFQIFVLRMLLKGQIPLHELPRDFPETSTTSPKLPRDKSETSRGSLGLVADLSATSSRRPRLPRDVRDFPETSPRRLGEVSVSDKSETSPRQVGGTPWISPTPPPCDVGVLQDG